MNCPHCRTENPRTCTVCSETLCCAKGASRCFTNHRVPPTQLVAEAIETSDTRAEARARVAAVRGHLDGFAAWRPYKHDPVGVAAGQRAIREFWGGRYRPVCGCAVGPDAIDDGRCARCCGAT
jgi:hypothetical protein